MFYKMDSKKVESFHLRVGVRKRLKPRLLAGMPKDFYAQFVLWKERHLHYAGDE
jgi:hypothetical protein